MTIRSQNETILINTLDGVKQSEPVIDERLPEMHGMHDNPAGSLHRIPGKTMLELSTTSTVWGLHQLRFREGTVVVEHEGPNIRGRTGGGFRGGAVPFIDELSIMEGDTPDAIKRVKGRVPFSEDISEENTPVTEIQDEPVDPRPAWAKSGRWELNVAVDPTTSNLDAGETQDITVGVWPLAAFGNLKISWNSAYITIGNIWSGGVIPVTSGQGVAYAFFADGIYQANEQFRITAGGAAPGTHVIPVTIEAVGAGNETLNPTEGNTTATHTVTVNGPPIYTGTIKVQTHEYETFPPGPWQRHKSVTGYIQASATYDPYWVAQVDTGPQQVIGGRRKDTGVWEFYWREDTDGDYYGRDVTFRASDGYPSVEWQSIGPAGTNNILRNLSIGPDVW
jgi:hypothetical protein